MAPPTQERIDFYGRLVCLPLALLINFSLFQYLFTMYYKRRREFHGMLLLGCGFGAFACLVPFAHSDDFVVNDLNNVSETLTTMTFLVQITMIGRDINKKMRIRVLRYMTRTSEVLILVGTAVAIKGVIELVIPNDEAVRRTNGWDNIVEEVSLWFIFGFRFFFIGMSKGYRSILETKKFELVMYLLFVTHEYPFQILNAATDLEWEEVQALWNRVTMALCLLHTIHAKIRNSSNTSKMQRGPSSHVTHNKNASSAKSTGADASGADKLAALGPSMRTLKKTTRTSAAVAPLAPLAETR